MKRRSFFGLLGAAVAGAAGVKAVEAAVEPEYGWTELSIPTGKSEYIRYSGYEPLNISPQDVLTSQEFDWTVVGINRDPLPYWRNRG